MTRVKARRESLRQTLDATRIEADAALQRRIRHERADRSTGVGDLLEQADANNQSDLEFALVQMRTDTLRRITEALARLDAGSYGSCLDCEADIAESRLRALPFAVRCRDCAERHELERRNEHRSAAAPDLDRVSPFATVVGP